MKKVIVTLDLENASSNNYKLLDEVMEEWGLSKFSPTQKELPLPANTYMGRFSDDLEAKDIRDSLRTLLRKNGLKVKAIFGGVLEDWAASIKY